MSKTPSFARRWRLLPVCCVLCATACLTPARAQDSDPLNPHITMHTNNVPFTAALKLLCSVAGIPLQLPADLAAQIDPNAKCNVDVTNGTFQDALSSLLAQANPPLEFHVENGMYVVGPSKTARVNKPAPRHSAFMMKGRSFEKAVDELLSGSGTRYRIDPAVTAFLDPVSVSMEDATLEQQLDALLKAVPGQKTPLVFRKEKDTYIIVPKDKTLVPDVNTTPIGLPSYHLEPTIKTITISNEHPGPALLRLFAQTGVNYHIVQSSSVADTPRVTLLMRDIPLEQAVVHLLRAAPAAPMLHLNIPDSMAAPPGMEANAPSQKITVYEVGPTSFAPPSAGEGSEPVYHHWFRYRDYDLYSALKALMMNARQSYLLDPGLRNVKVTVTGSDLPLEKAIAKLLEASSVPIKLTVRGNISEFRMPDNAGSGRRP